MEPKKKSKSEVGHIKNLNNFEKFILYCGKELQPKYNPVKARITVAGMQTHHEKATTAHLNVKQIREEFGIAVNYRQKLMDDIKIRATSMQGSLIGATEDQKIIEDFAGVNRKI